MDSFTFSGRIRSVKFAVDGIVLMLCNQHNAWVHLVATISVVIAGGLFGITSVQWVAVIVAIVLVWVAEGLNTAFELLCDVTNPEFHPIVKQAKDVSAGAVLISAIGALIIGLIVLVPYILSVLGV